MLELAGTTSAAKVLVATEIGMLHQLRRVNTSTVFEAVNPRAACPYMKMSTPDKLLRSLRDGVDEVTVDPEVADRARTAVERMVAIGSPSSVGE
jgi:quinolinate synthase